MNRRNLFKTILVAGAGVGIGSADAAADVAESVLRVVYHLADLDKVPFVLGNVRHHIEGVGGADRVRIAVVVHGPPLRAFRADTPDRAIRVDTAGLVRDGVTLFACIHTLEAMQLTPDALLPGFAVAPKGGVVMLAALQGQGWIYLRP